MAPAVQRQLDAGRMIRHQPSCGREPVVFTLSFRGHSRERDRR